MDAETIRREAKALVAATRPHRLVGGRVVVRDPALLASVTALLAEEGHAALGAAPAGHAPGEGAPAV